ncbi:hypothetical protein LZZ50_16275 [Xanthomonas arboricola]|uniref:hypothetical protein n=1 Tax=Xanthomonas arboricola TaxID=56448 RepID=UPI001FD6E99B|nr:hypothetical protein [Xanthomonas arboricola]UOS98062.1 hypothetical protein LZZ50_16275 [Xanthomonas arboricola]
MKRCIFIVARWRADVFQPTDATNRIGRMTVAELDRQIQPLACLVAAKPQDCLRVLASTVCNSALQPYLRRWTITPSAALTYTFMSAHARIAPLR